MSHCGSKDVVWYSTTNIWKSQLSSVQDTKVQREAIIKTKLQFLKYENTPSAIQWDTAFGFAARVAAVLFFASYYVSRNLLIQYTE